MTDLINSPKADQAPMVMSAQPGALATEAVELPIQPELPAVEADGTEIAEPVAASESLGQTIHALRLGRGLSLKMVATKSGLSAAAVYRIERGQSCPTYKSLVKLDKFYKADLLARFSDQLYGAPVGQTRPPQENLSPAEAAPAAPKKQTANAAMDASQPAPPPAGSAGQPHHRDQILTIIAGAIDVVAALLSTVNTMLQQENGK